MEAGVGEAQIPDEPVSVSLGPGHRCTQAVTWHHTCAPHSGLTLLQRLAGLLSPANRLTQLRFTVYEELGVTYCGALDLGPFWRRQPGGPGGESTGLMRL